MRNSLLLFTLILFAFGCNVFGQSRRLGSESHSMSSFGVQNSIGKIAGISCDTTDWGFPVDDTLELYGSGGWGFISGHNDYGDLAKAERVENFQHFPYVLGVRLTFKFGKSAGQNSKVKVFAYSEASGMPGAKLDSVDLYINDIIAAQGDVSVYFPNYVAVSGPFYVGMEMTYAAGDTVGLGSNSFGDSNPGTAWEQWSDLSWHAFNESSSWNEEMSMAIYPIVQTGQYTLSITPPSATIMSGNNVQLTATNTFIGTVNYEWYPTTGLSCSTCTNPIASPIVTTTYYAVGLSSSSCPVTESITVTVTPAVSVEDNLFGGKVVTYPNPASGEFMLSFDQTEATDLQIGLYNNLGQQVYSESLPNFVGAYNKAINLSNVSKGIYSLRITDNQAHRFISKMVVE